MRILQVIESLTRGGAERLALELAGEFKAAGHESRILCLRAPGPWAREAEQAGVYAGCIGKKPGIDASCVPRLRRFIDGFDADVVNSHLFTANLWTRLAGLGRRPWRLAVTLHNVDSWRGPLHRAVDRCLARAADHYIAVGPAVSDYWRRQGLSRWVMSLIPNAVRWNGAAYHRPFATASTVIRACGRLVPQKGFDVLVEAAFLALGAGARFTVEIIGDGPERRRLESAVRRRRLQGRVSFLGARDDARELIARADIFVLPSLREGLPLVLLEALHAGRPVVAARLPALEGVVADGREAVLVEAGSPGALAAGIQRLVADPARAAAMGLAGREKARRRFSIKRAARDYLRLYRNLLEGRRP